MSGRSDWLLRERASIVFDDIVRPVSADLIERYNGAGGLVVKVVPDGPLILGIERHSALRNIYFASLVETLSILMRTLLGSMSSRDKSFGNFRLDSEIFTVFIPFLASGILRKSSTSFSFKK